MAERDLKAYREEIRQYALSLGAAKCGFANIERFKDSLPGRHPLDIMPTAKSVIVIATRLLDGAVDANFRKFEDGYDVAHGIYGTYGYTMLPTFTMASQLYAMALKIERETGKMACPQFTGGPLVNGIALSLRHAAMAAGLGQFGWHTIILTPEFGPRNRFGALITDLELEPDPLYDGPTLCDPAKCKICVSRCPTRALQTYGDGAARSVDMEDQHVEYAHINWRRCQVACHMLTKSVGNTRDWLDFDIDRDPTAKEMEKAMDDKPLEETGLQVNPTWKCGLCLSYCPVGNWKEHFSDISAGPGKRAF